MPTGPQIGAAVPGMSGYHFVLNYNSSGQYTGTSIAPDAGGTSNGLPNAGQVLNSGISLPVYDMNFYWQVGVAVNQVIGQGTLGGPLPPGLNYSHFYFVGTPTTPGKYSTTITFPTFVWNLMMNITESAVATTATSNVAVTLIDWWTAWEAGWAGYKIRRATWVDKYLEVSAYTWFLQTFNATTRAMISRTVVTALDLVSSDFRASDWTLDGIPGQATSTSAAGAGSDNPALNQGNASGDVYIGTAARFSPTLTGYVLQLKDSSGQWVDEEVRVAS